MKIAAFNVQTLGSTKVNNESVVSYLIEIMSRYSVVVILEVRDTSGEAMEILLQKLNSASCNRNNPFSMTSSEPLGRETYICFYREADVTLRDCYQFPDDRVGNVDAFSIEPYALHFSCPNTAVKNLVLILVRTKPDDAEKELNNLHYVVQAVRKKWGIGEMMVLGNVNADGRYLPLEQKSNIQICCPPYYWLINDDVDTTSSNCNDNTYDRIVVFGEDMLKAVIIDSAKGLNFRREFDLPDEQTLSVVEVELKGKEGRRGGFKGRRSSRGCKRMKKTKKKNTELDVKQEMKVKEEEEKEKMEMKVKVKEEKEEMKVKEEEEEIEMKVMSPKRKREEPSTSPAKRR